jgi:hypothetical protein
MVTGLIFYYFEELHRLQTVNKLDHIFHVTPKPKAEWLRSHKALHQWLDALVG